MHTNGLGTVSNLGYPRIGERREWKKQLESYWKGEIGEPQLTESLQGIRLNNLRKQKEAGVDSIPVADFSFYDHVLDHSIAFGLIPERFQSIAAHGELALYFAMARGAEGIPACEMTKWFNTNYHYIVPEWTEQTAPFLRNNPWLAAYQEAAGELGLQAKPVLIGPYTFAALSKGISPDHFNEALISLLPVYGKLLAQLQAAGVEWVQVDEPALSGDVPETHWPLLSSIYGDLKQSAPGLRLMLQTYFDAVDRMDLLLNLPVHGVGLDFVHDKGGNLEALSQNGFPVDKVLGAGIVDGRNIWRTDLSAALILLDRIQYFVPGDRLVLQPSCSLLHSPVTLAYEQKLQGLAKKSLAFADEKLGELALLSRALREGRQAVQPELDANSAMIAALGRSEQRNRFGGETVPDADLRAGRTTPFQDRLALQQDKWQLPLLPTTTIGSLPQTSEVRKARQQWRKGELTDAEYEAFIQGKIAEWIHIQEELGLDVLVHGEFERNDMVEFFGEKLEGYLFTENGWVQSYGSRCVKPPVIFGDVVHTAPMTVKETVYAASQTDKPVKGMLTGPLTMLNWSFVRTDIPRKEVAFQLAGAIRCEVEALEAAGIGMIQVDEPALREGAPLKNREWDAYLAWGVEAFRQSVAAAEDTTQIHTHMCYCDFHEILDAIEAMDADVISLETSRSHGILIDALRNEAYGKGIGLGVYDIHSPFIPETEVMEKIIQDSLEVTPAHLLWINPDCGLKTRNVEETLTSLRRMVEAAKRSREALLVQ